MSCVSDREKPELFCIFKSVNLKASLRDSWRVSFPDAIVVIPAVLEDGVIELTFHVVSKLMLVPEAVEVEDIVRGVATLI